MVEGEGFEPSKS